MNISISTNPCTSLMFRWEETYFSKSDIIQCIWPVYIISVRQRLNAIRGSLSGSQWEGAGWGAASVTGHVFEQAALPPQTTVLVIVEFCLKSCLIASVYVRLCVSANSRRVVLWSGWGVLCVLFPLSVVSQAFTVAASRTFF